MQMLQYNNYIFMLLGYINKIIIFTTEVMKVLGITQITESALICEL